MLRSERPASPPPQDQDIPDPEPPRESVAPGRGARQWRVHRNDDRNPARWRRYTSYKVANFFSGVGITGVWIDPKYDIDVVPGHLHPLDQGPDEVAVARPAR